MKMSIVEGNITSFDSDMIVNSSNGYLIHGTSVAEQIRDAAGYLPRDDKRYWEIVGTASSSNETLKKILDYVHMKRPDPSKLQIESLEKIIDNNFKPYRQGDAVLTTSGDLADKKGKADYVSHCIGMNYSSYSPPVIVPATTDSVFSSIVKSLGYASVLGCKTVSIPIMCTRKGGLTVPESCVATKIALKKFGLKKSSVKDVNIVLHSNELQREKDLIEELILRNL